MNHFFESQVKFFNKNSLLKPLGSNETIKQDNTSAIQLENIDEIKGVKEQNILRWDTFISLTNSKEETSAELFTSQLKEWKVIILHKPFREKYSAPIVKHSG